MTKTNKELEHTRKIVTSMSDKYKDNRDMQQLINTLQKSLR
jgi:hypothetical protein